MPSPSKDIRLDKQQQTGLGTNVPPEPGKEKRVVVFENEKQKAAIAALKTFKHSNPEALIKKYGLDRVALEISRCQHALTKPAWIKTTPAAWIEGSCKTPEGFNIPPGFVSEEARKAQAAREAAQEKDRAREDAAALSEKTRREKLQKKFKALSSEQRETILNRVVCKLERDGTRFEVEKFKKLATGGIELAVEKHIAARVYRDEILEYE
jgi:hypothetical protein